MQTSKIPGAPVPDKHWVAVRLLAIALTLSVIDKTCNIREDRRRAWFGKTGLPLYLA